MFHASLDIWPQNVCITNENNSNFSHTFHVNNHCCLPLHSRRILWLEELYLFGQLYRSPLGTRRCCDVESTSMTLIQCRNKVVCPVGLHSLWNSGRRTRPHHGTKVSNVMSSRVMQRETDYSPQTIRCHETQRITTYNHTWQPELSVVSATHLSDTRDTLAAVSIHACCYHLSLFRLIPRLDRVDSVETTQTSWVVGSSPVLCLGTSASITVYGYILSTISESKIQNILLNFIF